MSYVFDTQQLGADVGQPASSPRLRRLVARAAARRPFYRIGDGRLRRAIRGRVLRRGPGVGPYGGLTYRLAYPAGAELHGLGRQHVVLEDDGLGFSLKPPKWLRKAQPGKFLKKLAVPAAIIAGAVVAGPAVFAAGKFVGGKLLVPAGKALLRGARGILPARRQHPQSGASGFPPWDDPTVEQAPGAWPAPTITAVEPHPVPIVSSASSDVPLPGRVDYSGLPSRTMYEGAGMAAGSEALERGGAEIEQAGIGPGPKAGAQMLPWLAVGAGVLALTALSRGVRR